MYEKDSIRPALRLSSPKSSFRDLSALGVQHQPEPCSAGEHKVKKEWPQSSWQEPAKFCPSTLLAAQRHLHAGSF